MGMGVHTAIFAGTAASTSGSYGILNGQSDSVLGLRNNRLIPTTNMSLLAAAAMVGGQITAARLSTPSTVISPVHIHPFNQGAYPLTEPTTPNVLVCVNNPVMMRSGEEITVEVLGNPAPAAAVIWLCQQMEPVPPGESFWIRFSAPNSAGLAGSAWVTVPGLQFEKSSLPSGRYAIVGIDVTGQSTGALLCARLILPGEVMRPGALVLTNPGATPHWMVEQASLGVLGKFDALLPPAIEVYSSPAGMGATFDLTAFQGYLRIIKIA